MNKTRSQGEPQIDLAREDIKLFDPDFNISSPGFENLHYDEDYDNDFEGVQYVKFDIFGKPISQYLQDSMKKEESVNISSFNNQCNVKEQNDDLDEEKEEEINYNKENFDPVSFMQTPSKPRNNFKPGSNTLSSFYSNRSPLYDITPPLPRTKQKMNTTQVEKALKYCSTPKNFLSEFKGTKNSIRQLI